MRECIRLVHLSISSIGNVLFQGTMLIEMSTTSPQPIALEMNEGCTESDAWLLLSRLNSTVPAQTPHRSSLDPIYIFP